MALNIVSIGSSSSGNSYLITDGRTNVLLDVGLSGKAIKTALASLGVAPADISAILVTHEHIDHVKSIRMMARECENALVYASRGTAHSCANFEYVPADRLRLVESQDEFAIGQIRTRAFALSHDAVEPISYTFEVQDPTAFSAGAGAGIGISAKSGGNAGRDDSRVLTVVTDTGIVTDEIYHEMQRADKLVLEANHEVSILEVGPYPYSLKRRILSDFGHLSNEAAGKALARVIEYREQTYGLATASDTDPAIVSAAGSIAGSHAYGRDPLTVMLAHLSTTNNTPDNAGLTVTDVLRDRGFATGQDYNLNIAAKSDLTPITAPATDK